MCHVTTEIDYQINSEIAYFRYGMCSLVSILKWSNLKMIWLPVRFAQAAVGKQIAINTAKSFPQLRIMVWLDLGKCNLTWETMPLVAFLPEYVSCYNASELIFDSTRVFSSFWGGASRAEERWKVLLKLSDNP